MVLALRPLACARRRAARPVGEQSATLTFRVSSAAMTPFKRRRLAGARAAGEHAELVRAGRLHRALLLRRQPRVPLRRQRGGKTRPVEPRRPLRQGRGRARQLTETPRGLAFGALPLRQVDGHLALHLDPVPGHQVARLQRPLQHRLQRARVVQRQQVGGFRQQFLPGREDVPFLRHLRQREAQTGAQALGRVGRFAHVARDVVRAAEADAVDLVGQGPGVGLHRRDGLHAQLLVDALRHAPADALLLQEDQGVAAVLLRPPGLRQGPRQRRPQHLPQALRRLLQHRQRVGAEVFDDALRRTRADAPDEAAAQVTGDAALADGG